MSVAIDSARFGPWALITGASSGIGRELARQVAENGINVVLVARREHLLEEAGREFEERYRVKYRTLAVDVTDDDFVRRVCDATGDLDVGLIASNAGTAKPAAFLDVDPSLIVHQVRLNAVSHALLARHFAPKLVERSSGGILFSGAMGALQGVPFMANDSGAKSYIQSFGEALHVELKPKNVHVSVLVIGPTQTAIIEKFGLAPEAMPMKPMSAEQCAREGLEALIANRATHISGRANRIMSALLPARLSRAMMGAMLAKTLAQSS